MKTFATKSLINATILLGMLTVIINQTASAQAPAIQWQNTIGGNNYDYLRCSFPTTDGGFILGGESWSDYSGDKTEGTFGMGDYWVVKTNGYGTILWQNNIGGSGADRLYSIQQTEDGGYILGGESSSNISGDKTENKIGYTDYWIVKLNAAGNIEWQNTIGGTDFNNLRTIEQTPDGGYIVGGYSSSGISGDKTEASIGSSDFWVLKLNNAGTVEWQNTIGGDNADDLQVIHQTGDGYILGGSSSSGISGDKTEANIGYRDYWIVKIDLMGNIQWQNTIGGSDNDHLADLTKSTDGGYLIGGTSSSDISGDKTEPAEDSDYWVLKLDINGNIIWQNTIGGDNPDELYKVLEGEHGDYLIGGSSSSGISSDKTEINIGNNDYWILKLDADGNILWQNTIGGVASDILTSLSLCDDHAFMISGWSFSGISGDKTEASQGQSDYWIVKLYPESFPCNPPIDFSSLVSTNKAKVEWLNAMDAIGYKVRYRMAGTEGWIPKYILSNNFAILKGLTCNTNYEWQVMSICAEDGSSYSAYSPAQYFTTMSCRMEYATNNAIEVFIYPNPAINEVNIILKGGSGEGFISIVDMNGQIVFENNIQIDGEYKITWYPDQISSGIYQLQIITESNIYSEKILIIR